MSTKGIMEAAKWACAGQTQGKTTYGRNGGPGRAVRTLNTKRREILWRIAEIGPEKVEKFTHIVSLFLSKMLSHILTT